MAVTCTKWIISFPNIVLINLFYSKPKNDSKETVIEIHSKLEVALNMLLNAFCNVNADARLLGRQLPTLKQELYRSWLHKLSIKPQGEYFYKFRILNKDPSTLPGSRMPTQEKNNTYIDKMTV